MVSPGWWSGRISFGFYGFLHAFCGEISEIPRRARGILGDGWKTTIGGAVRRADIWDGEYYDARCPDPTADPEKFDWTDALPFTEATCRIVRLVGEPIRRRKDLERAPQSAVVYLGNEENGSDYGRIHVIRKRVGAGCEAGVLAAGESLILDFGQNIVGRPRLRVKARRGAVIRGYFAEMLNDSGLALRGNDGPGQPVYKNYRSALARLVYVAAGDGKSAMFRFTLFTGSVTLKLTADADIEILEVAGEVITSVLRETGHIETDNPEVNRLLSNMPGVARQLPLYLPTARSATASMVRRHTDLARQATFAM